MNVPKQGEGLVPGGIYLSIKLLCMCTGTILPRLSYHVPQQGEGLVPVRPSAVGTSGVGNQHSL